MNRAVPFGQPLLLIVPGLGPMELVIIVLALLLLFGAKRIPLIARGLGEGIRDFKRSLAGEDEEDETRRLESGSKDDD